MIGCGPGTRQDTVTVSTRVASRSDRPTCLALGHDGAVIARLSATGCFADTADLKPANNVAGYSVQSELWTDGAVKQRFVYLPPGTSLDITSNNEFIVPGGTVIFKNFAFLQDGEVQNIETRMMIRDGDSWQFHTYVWDETGSDAELIPASDAVTLSIDIDGQPESLEYLVPAERHCKLCHAPDGAELLGLVPRQLAGQVDVADESGSIEQLEFLARYGYISGTHVSSPWPEPSDSQAALNARARSYLAANCSHCHRPGGMANNVGVVMDLSYDTPLAETGLCDVATSLVSTLIHRVEPGAPEESWLYLRMIADDDTRMPPLGTSLHDTLGIGLIRDWIQTMVACK